MVLEHLVNKPINEVFEHLTDIKKFCNVHPVIYKIEERADNQVFIYERLPFLFIPFYFTYPATISGNGNRVEMKAVVKKMAHITLSFFLETNDGTSTKVTETIDVKSFLPIHFIMNRIFKKQHTILFENMSKKS